jgi:hypothetical protein
MPLIPQQDIVVVTRPYTVEKGQSVQAAAAAKLRWMLDQYPPCRIVAIDSHGPGIDYTLTAVIETI